MSDRRRPGDGAGGRDESVSLTNEGEDEEEDEGADEGADKTLRRSCFLLTSVFSDSFIPH